MKRLIIYVVVLILSACLCACSSQQSSEATVIDMNDDAAVSALSQEEPPSDAMPEDGTFQEGAFLGDFPDGSAGERPSGSKTSGTDNTEGSTGSESGKKTGRARAADADVIGRVDSIIGNEAVLALGSMDNNTFSETGETATYLLPVGMPVGDGDFSTVTTGMVLGLSLNDAGTITAVFVLSR